MSIGENVAANLPYLRRYARALTPSVRRYSAYDGMPGIEHRSHGWVTGT